MNVSIIQSDLLRAQSSLQFNWVTRQLPYLGVHLTSSLSDLFAANYLPLLKQTTALMKQWSSLPLSWLGWINAVKMSILPNFLYLFRVLPVSLLSYFLRLIQRRVMSFIWDKIKPRIPKSTLYLSKSCGGLGLPNFSSYYYAAQLSILTKYHSTENIPLWVAIESIDCDPISIDNLLWILPKDRSHLTNPIMKHSLAIWDRFNDSHGLRSKHNPLLSFLGNPAFYPAWKFPKSFSAWSSRKLTRLYKLVTTDTLQTFPMLCKNHELSNNEIFRYLQIKNFFTPLLSLSTSINQMSQFEHICISDPHVRGLISCVYQILITNSNMNIPSYTVKWAQAMGRIFDNNDWSNIWLDTKSSSPNCFALETNFKVLVRWYLVPARIAKFTPSYPNNCFKACSSPGTHFHIWWDCPVAQEFWEKIFAMASKALDISITPDPAIALPNLKPASLTMVQFKILIHINTAAKQTIAKAWKNKNLIEAEVKHRMNKALIFAKMPAIEDNNINKFHLIWQPWVKHFLTSDFDQSLLPC